MAIVEAIPQIIEGIITAVLDAIPLIIQAGIDLLITLIQALPQIITTIVAAIPEIIDGIITALTNSIPQIIQTGVELLISLIANLPTIIAEIVKAIPQIITGIVSALGKGVSQIAEVGANLVRGLWQGIQSLASWIWNKVSGWISSIWDGICDFFGIASPSKEMGWVGEMLVEGLAGAINDNGKDAVKAAESMADDINGVMGDLANEMQTSLPTDFNVTGTVNRNFTTTVPGKSGVADFGADFDYREITAHCNIYPKQNFAALVSALDDIAAWLDPVQGLRQLVFDDVPDRYFMARLNDAVDCERLIRSAGSFDLKFFCPDPFAYSITDETFSITEAGTHTVTRTIGNMESLPIYRIEGVVTAGASNYISITTNGTELKIVNAALSEGEALIVDIDKMTAYVVDANGEMLRNGLPYLQELNFPTLHVGENTVIVEVSNVTLIELQIQAKSRWR